jgi:GTP-binding protein EngB required for normal cell division
MAFPKLPPAKSVEVIQLPHVLPKPDKNLPQLQSLSPEEESQALYLLIIGETGVGKTTLVNTIVNHLMGVKIEDTYRYELVKEGTNTAQNVSQTTKISKYAIKSKTFNRTVILIDTPGFGDTGGMQEDKKIEAMLRLLVQNELERIHMIGFATKATTLRFTEMQKYICNKVVSLFSDSAVPNMCFLFTFCDCNHPQVVKEFPKFTEPNMKLLIVNMGMNWYFKFNNSTLYNPYNQADILSKTFWDLSHSGVNDMMNKLLSSKAYVIKPPKSSIFATPVTQQSPSKPSISATPVTQPKAQTLSPKVQTANPTATSEPRNKPSNAPAADIKHLRDELANTLTKLYCLAKSDPPLSKDHFSKNYWPEELLEAYQKYFDLLESKNLSEKRQELKKRVTCVMVMLIHSQQPTIIDEVYKEVFISIKADSALSKLVEECRSKAIKIKDYVLNNPFQSYNDLRDQDW